MSSGVTEGGRTDVLSHHLCPEVDLLPQHCSDAQIPPTRSLVPMGKGSELTCSDKKEADYLSVLSTGNYADEEEKDEGSISDWSEEDLLLHFSPSVVFQSDNEDSGSERDFKCVDLSVETQVNGQQGEELKMVPKRQVQLKRKEEQNIFDQESNGHPDGARVTKEANPHPELLLRQHSLPASFHTSKTGPDVDTYRVYQGLVPGNSKGMSAGKSRHFQKSLSLDETKTKMASCFITNILWRKMQSDQSVSATTHLEMKCKGASARPLPAKQQGENTGAGVFKTPFSMLREMKTSVKDAYTNTTAARPDSHRSTGIKLIRQEESLPSTYQQAPTKSHVIMFTAPFSKSANKNHSERLSHQTTQQKQGSEPIMSKSKRDDVPLLGQSTGTINNNLLEFSQSEGAVSESTCKTVLDSSSEMAPGHSQPVLHPCFCSPNIYPPLTPVNSTVHQPHLTPHLTPISNTIQHPHLNPVNFIHNPLSYIQTQLQQIPSTATLQLGRRSEENQNKSTENQSNQPDQTSTAGDQDGHSSSMKPPVQEQQQKQFMCNLKGFKPPQVARELAADVTGCVVAHRALLSIPPSYHLMLDPKSGQCFYVVTPPQPQRKMLLDPETGQFVQVFLPAVSSSPNTSLFPVSPSNHIPTMFHVGSANPIVFSVVPFQPLNPLSSLCASYNPVTMTAPAAP